MMLRPDKTRAAIYAQERRDNEIEARNELQKRIAGVTPIAVDLDSRGDFNLTTKVLAQALLCLKPDTNVPSQVKARTTTPSLQSTMH